MYYALGTVHQLPVREVVVVAVMIEVMALLKRIAKAVIAVLAAATILGPTIFGGQGR